MSTITTVNSCNVEVEIEGCSKEVISIACENSDANAPPEQSRFEAEFFNQGSLFVTQQAHRLNTIQDAYVLDLQRKKMLCDITISHNTLYVTIQFTAPTSGFLIITQ